jgi:plasmid stabilization system protein ParE
MQDFPLMGAPRPQLASGLRVIHHGSYAIYYLPRVDEILMVRVLHGSRDVLAFVEGGGFAS